MSSVWGWRWVLLAVLVQEGAAAGAPKEAEEKPQAEEKGSFFSSIKSAFGMGGTSEEGKADEIKKPAPYNPGADQQGAPLDEFCGLALGGNQVHEAMVVDCSCCANSMVTDVAAQVEILYGGQPAMAPAFADDGATLAGQVPVWSLGKHVPKVICNLGRPMCSCEAQDTSWTQFEPSCRPGPKCRHDEPPREWPTVCAEGVHCSNRDRALGRAGGGIPPVHHDDLTDCASRGHRRLEHLMHLAGAKSFKDSAVIKILQRVSLGAARCENMSPDQCHMFYAEVDNEWRHCEAAATKVMQCSAAVVSEADATKRYSTMEAWAAKTAYSPGAWPVKVLADGTLEAESIPTREAMMKQVANLPSKVPLSALRFF